MDLSILLIVSLCLVNHPVGVVSTAEKDIEAIEDFIKTVMEKHEIPGLSLAVVNGSKVFMSKGYGHTGLTNESSPVTEDTLFFIGSTTEAFTATLLGEILKDSSKYDLDTPVRDILPEFHLSAFDRQEMTTVRDLLAHRTGILDSHYNWLLGEVTTRKDILSRARFFPINRATSFRSFISHNYLHYITAGLVAEKLEDKPWEELIKEKIFQPLGMTNSSFMDRLTDSEIDKLAIPHDKDWRDDNNMKRISLDFYRNAGPGGPTGTIVSSAKDLAKWLLMLTKSGLNEQGNVVIDSDVIKDTMQPHVVSHSPPGEEPFNYTSDTYGMGWFTGYFMGYRQVQHRPMGYWKGYYSRATVYPEQKLAIFTCVNGDQGDGQTHIHNFISELLLTRQHNYSSLMFNREFRPRPSSVIVPSDEQHSDKLGEYTGQYGNFAFGNITISLNTSTGRLQGLYGNLMYVDMHHNRTDHFTGQATDPLWFFPPIQMNFKRVSRKIVSLVVPSLLLDSPPEFIKNLKFAAADPPRSSRNSANSNQILSLIEYSSILIAYKVLMQFH